MLCHEAFIIDRYGNIDCVRAREMPIPELREEGVAAESPWIRDRFLGHEVAGEVVGVGARVRRFKLGDAVNSIGNHFYVI